MCTNCSAADFQAVDGKVVESLPFRVLFLDVLDAVGGNTREEGSLGVNPARDVFECREHTVHRGRGQLSLPTFACW